MLLRCRIAAGGDKRFRQSRLGSDTADGFGPDEDPLEDKDDFAKFDEPTRIEGEGGDVDPDPGDRESVRGLHRMHSVELSVNASNSGHHFRSTVSVV